ncbi:hypothetical protein RQP46_006880 [Phenoliferia psychrophenolica]
MAAEAHTAATAEAFTEAFGAELAPAFLTLKEKMDKVRYESFKASIVAMAPLQAQVAEMGAKVPKFWVTSLVNCSETRNHIPKCDVPALEALTNVSVQYGDDIRNFDVVFTFAENAYFSNPTLTLSFTVTPPAGETAPKPFDLSPDVYMKPVTTIQWKSDDVNLVKKAPKVDIEDLDDDAEISEETGFGSFFNFFSQSGEDTEEIGEALCEWRVQALEYATGSDKSDDEWSDDGEGDDNEDAEME